ncbi:MAG: hypothetical protein GQ574_16005 [Crocinitomix sp.]|nr:hypothetical protein [Crocinitomix sp.]
MILNTITCLLFFSCENSSSSEPDRLDLTEISQSNSAVAHSENEIVHFPADLTIDTNYMEVIKLPRPNSGTYSYAEAEKKRIDIYNLRPTDKYIDWINPTTGGSVHINERDELEVYKTTFPLFQDTTPINIFVPDSINLRKHVGGIGLGNPASVLITSEINPIGSTGMDKIFKDLYHPGTQLYYLKSKSLPSPQWFSNH